MIDYADPSDEWPQRVGGDFWRNQKGSPMVARLRKRQGAKADLIAAAAAADIKVPDKATVADLHELLGPEPGARLEYGRPSHWPFDDWTGVDIKYADRGTLAHDLTEWLDKGGTPDTIPAAMFARATALDVGPELLVFIASDWVRFRSEYGLVPTYIEHTVVHDDLMVAGTADEYATATIRIDTPFGTVEPGELVVIDKKTSDNCTRPGYAAQLARYAHSVPYDTETDLRGEWPQPVNKCIGFFAQFRMSAALDGDTSVRWELIPADIDAGNTIAHEIHRLKTVDVSAAFGEPIAPPVSSPSTVEAPGGGDVTHGNAASPLPTLEEAREAARALSPADAKLLAEYLDEHPELDRTDGSQMMTAVAAVHHFRTTQTEPAPRPPVSPVIQASAKVIDEGPDIDATTVAAAGKRYAALDDAARSWVSVCAAGVRLSPDHGGVASVRRMELLRGLCELGESDGFDTDDMVRAIAAVSGLGDAAWQTRRIADVVAALTLDEAVTFAKVADVVTTGDVAIRWESDGRCVLSASVLGRVAA